MLIAVPKLGARIRRLVGIQIVFLLGLPIIGSPVGFICYALWAGGTSSIKIVAAGALFAPLVLFGPAFALSLLPAVTTGLSIGVRQAFFGPTPAAMVFALVVLNGLLAYSIMQGDFGSVPSLAGETPSEHLATACSVLGVVVATFACRQFTRNWHFGGKRNLVMST